MNSLSSRRDRAKLKWWHNLCTMKGDRYPRQLFDQVWEVKPPRGRQRKMWGKRVDDIFEALLLDKQELLDGIKKGNSSSKSFLACVDECVSERESKAFWKGLHIKYMYKRFVKQREFKKYLHGFCDAGTRLLFTFRSGTHGLNEELRRHRGREGKVECTICGAECEVQFVCCGSVQHIARVEKALGQSSRS